ncbi:hypothetical protein SEUCBS139899_002574 [Sporothrix eucalyptigena]
MFSRRENDKPLHLGLTPHCGLCGTTLTVGQACIALLGVDKATQYSRRTNAFQYPKYGFFHGEWSLRGEEEDGPILCRNPECTKGTADLEACTVHVACLALFEKVGAEKRKDNAESLDRLWVASSWQRPWRQAAWLWLDVADARRIAIQRLVAATVSDESGDEKNEASLREVLQRIQRLPPELVQIIHDFSSESPVWRLAAVLDRYHETMSAQDNLPTSMPLDTVAAWERGSQPMLVGEDAAGKPIFRFTMDIHGLRSIERLMERPAVSTSRVTQTEAYTVVHQDQAPGVVVHFRYGLARLELPRRMRGLHIWDTPTPPALDDCHMVLSRILPFTRFQNIPLDHPSITGLTFIFEHSKVAAAHVHTPSTPAARITTLCLRPIDLAWVYIPFAAEDRVLAFGARRCAEEVRNVELDEEAQAEYEATQNAKADDSNGEEPEEEFVDYGNQYREYSMGFVFRMKLAGDIYLGPMIREPREDTVLAAEPPVNLVFSTIESFILSVVGAYSDTSLPKSLPPISPPLGDPQPRPIATANDHMYLLSTAHLDGIVRIRVFSDPVRGFDRGLLFYYKNGGQRALGQCRVGVDDEKDYDDPACLCISRDGFTHVVEDRAPREPGTQRWHVFYAQAMDDIEEHTHEDENGIWECIPLGEGCGRLEVSFTAKSSRLEVMEDDEDKRVWRKKRLDESIQNFHRRPRE